MKKIIMLMLTMMLAVSFSVASAAGKYVYYLDSDGSIGYSQKDVKNIVDQIQKKLPADVTLTPDDDFYVNMDKLRVERQQNLLNHLKAHYPYFEALAGKEKCKLMPLIIDECFRYYPNDFAGVVVVQLIPLKQQVTMNEADKIFGLGGVKNQVEVMAAIMVYDKASKQYVYTYNEKFNEKISSADWSGVVASKKLVPMMLKNINQISVK